MMQSFAAIPSSLQNKFQYRTRVHGPLPKLNQRMFSLDSMQYEENNKS